MATVQESIPTGTVTFLFSDVVGSTRLWAQDHDAMAASLRIHDAIFTETIPKFHGHVFATAGDSFAASFQRASSAVECALAIQDALGSVDWDTWPALEVRMGLHVGEADERDGNYFGPAVNQAARVMSVAHGGQVVLTDGVRDAAGIESVDLGSHQLRDIEAPVHLNQLGEAAFPPLTSMGVGIVSLPSPRTSLIGRDDSILEVRRLLAQHRLVTLAGVGGCGKTRLAIEVAYREISSHPDGVWFVDLSTIADASALPGVFATALDLSFSPGADPIDQIATYLAPRRALVVIDNCEHVIDAVADIIDVLLERSESLQIVATSREALDVDGEFTWKVPSLATGADAASVELFFERARASGAELADDEATRATVAEVVERLDGVPLAIELAAARTRSMAVTEILELLDDRFSLLSGGSRRARQRQATLEGAVQWSYGLLGHDEQSMLRALSVFQGGFSIADVAPVAQHTERESRDLIDALVAKSLIDISRDASGTYRHRLLETIRLFALARLIDEGEAVATRDRHLEHFSWGDDELTMATGLPIDFVARSGREYENLRSAIAWAIERGRPEPAVRIAMLSSGAAEVRGEVNQVISVLRQDVELRPSEEGFRLARLGHLLLTASIDVMGALEACQAARALAIEQPGDYVVLALSTEGALAGTLGDMVKQQELFAEALDVAQNFGDANVIAIASLFVASSDVASLRFGRARNLLNDALNLAPHFGYRHALEAYLALAMLLQGDIEQASKVASEFSPIPPSSPWSHFNGLIELLVTAHADGVVAAGQLLAEAARAELPKRPHIGPDYLLAFGYLHRLADEQSRFDELALSCIPYLFASIAMTCFDYGVELSTENIAPLWARFVEDNPPLARRERFQRDGARLIDEEITYWEDRSSTA